jgi:hypothetical protein
VTFVPLENDTRSKKETAHGKKSTGGGVKSDPRETGTGSHGSLPTRPIAATAIKLMLGTARPYVVAH